MNAISKITKKVEADYERIEQDIKNVNWINRWKIYELNSRIQKLESTVNKVLDELTYSNMPIEELKDKTVWLRWYKSGITELKDKLDQKDFWKWFWQLSIQKR